VKRPIRPFPFRVISGREKKRKKGEKEEAGIERIAQDYNNNLYLTKTNFFDVFQLDWQGKD